MDSKTSVLLGGLIYPEGPRWHDGKLFFSDVLGQKVMTVSLDGKSEIIVEVPNQPSGLGWLPDGRLLIVSITDQRLLRLDPEGVVEVANLSDIASFWLNDMVVDNYGRAYIGNLGFDLLNQAPFSPAEIILVTPEGDKRVVADNMAFPNGSVVTPDGSTLIVAESYGSCLTAFNIEADGSLSGRRIWAKLEANAPDGICLDAEGAIWVASPSSLEVVRIYEGGEISHRIKTSMPPFACMLGGAHRRTLFILTHNPEMGAKLEKSGQVEIIEVDVPGDGIP